MVARLVLGILASTFLPLGIVFLAIGLLSDEVEDGDPAAFAYLGAALVAFGVALTLAFAVLWRAEAARRRRRRAGLRASVEVLEAEVRHGVQSGRKRALVLTVRTPSGAPATHTCLVLPEAAPAAGERIEILYDPAEPANFEPA